MSLDQMSSANLSVCQPKRHLAKNQTFMKKCENAWNIYYTTATSIVAKPGDKSAMHVKMNPITK